MMSSDGLSLIRTPEALRELLGPPVQRALDKERAELHEMDRAWIAASPMCLVATAGADGHCDISPKGDPRGQLVHVLSGTQIVLAERPGNGRADGFHNLLENPGISLIFLVPGRGATLRVRGRARLVRDAPFFDALRVRGHRPQLAVLIDIDTIFFHCAKAFLRSELWDPASWRPDELPSHAQIVKATQATEKSLEELEAYYGPSYGKNLYVERERPLVLRAAKADECEALGALALRSKAVWGYSAAFMEACRDELQVEPDAVSDTTVCTRDGRVVGFYTLVNLSETRAELEALFIEPDALRQGVGSALLDHARDEARSRGVTEVEIQGDPNADAFYRKHGAEQVGTRPSGSIEGRALPLYLLRV